MKLDLSRVKEAAPLFRALGKGLVNTLRRAFTRLFQLYFSPLKLFQEIKAAPDASAPAALIILALTLQTLVAVALLAGVTIDTPEGEKDALAPLRSNILVYIVIRIASILSLWFILFIVFWFLLYVLGSRLEGFTVFSATGYVLSSQIVMFLGVYLIYVFAGSLAPSVRLVSPRDFYPHLLSLAALEYRLTLAGANLGLPLKGLIEGLEYFGTAWEIALLLIVFKNIGELKLWKALLGVFTGILTTWLIAGIFQAAGLL